MKSLFNLMAFVHFYESHRGCMCVYACVRARAFIRACVRVDGCLPS